MEVAQLKTDRQVLLKSSAVVFPKYRHRDAGVSWRPNINTTGSRDQKLRHHDRDEGGNGMFEK